MVRRVVLIPVYNEERHLEGLLGRLRQIYDEDVLLIDDGSVDDSPCILKSMNDERTHTILHDRNRGYGATLVAGFEEVIRRGYDYVITMDSDGQHRPDWIPEFFNLIPKWDIVSGSRYCPESDRTGVVPEDRRAINGKITARINEITGFSLTDSFCGFKAYTVSALRKLSITEFGYAMPLQVWMQADSCTLDLFGSFPIIWRSTRSSRSTIEVLQPSHSTKHRTDGATGLPTPSRFGNL